MENKTPEQQNTPTHMSIESRLSDILHKIQSKKISTHSKTFFRLKLAVFVLVIVAICVVSIMLCSFILFTIRMTGQPGLIDFGSQGLKLIFFIFPWILFLLDGLLILLLGVMTRHTSFGYKIPGVYILIGAIGIIGISGYIVEAKTNFHPNMLRYADKKELPLFTLLYKNTRRAPPTGFEIYKGVVVDRGQGFVFIDLYKEDGVGTTTRVSVKFMADPLSISNFQIGQTVFISGKIIDGQIINARIKPVSQMVPVE